MEQLNKILEASKNDGVVCFDVFWHDVKLDDIDVSGDKSTNKENVWKIFFSKEFIRVPRMMLKSNYINNRYDILEAIADDYIRTILDSFNAIPSNEEIIGMDTSKVQHMTPQIFFWKKKNNEENEETLHFAFNVPTDEPEQPKHILGNQLNCHIVLLFLLTIHNIWRAHKIHTLEYKSPDDYLEKNRFKWTISKQILHIEQPNAEGSNFFIYYKDEPYSLWKFYKTTIFRNVHNKTKLLNLMKNFIKDKLQNSYWYTYDVTLNDEFFIISRIDKSL